MPKSVTSRPVSARDLRTSENVAITDEDRAASVLPGVRWVVAGPAPSCLGGGAATSVRPPSLRDPHAPARRPPPGLHRRADAVLGNGLRRHDAGRPLPGAAELDGAVVQPQGRRSWRVWSCHDHLAGLTGLRGFPAEPGVSILNGPPRSTPRTCGARSPACARTLA